jgi:ADP-ribose 1''-phosphate phosphatase
MIIYHKGSLFDAPKNSVLVHACNCQGAWGSGIAREFFKRFPLSFKEYKSHCVMAKLRGQQIQGQSLITVEENGQNVGCLFTSRGYAHSLDSKEQILANTEQALEQFYDEWMILGGDREIHSNKFNSGLFRVEWEKTEALLQQLVDRTGVTWHVWEP